MLYNAKCGFQKVLKKLKGFGMRKNHDALWKKKLGRLARLILGIIRENKEQMKASIMNCDVENMVE